MRVAAELWGGGGFVEDDVSWHAVDLPIERMPLGALQARLVDKVIRRKARAAAERPFEK
jgi:hypothetical protein